MRTLGRRAAVATLGAGLLAAGRPGGALAQAANQWFALRGDDGSPTPNSRAPVELVEEIEELRGAIWAGPASGAVKLVEFFDYNCPWCRAAHRDLELLRRENPDLRVGLVNNPILSRMSAEAARVDLGLLRLKGAGASYGLQRRLFSTPGRIDRSRALEAAAALGADRGELERETDSPEVAAMLDRQMSLAASLGIAATPSYVVGGAVVLGYPGPKSLARIVADARACGTIAC